MVEPKRRDLYFNMSIMHFQAITLLDFFRLWRNCKRDRSHKCWGMVETVLEKLKLYGWASKYADKIDKLEGPFFCLKILSRWL